MTEEIIIDGVDVAGCEFCKPNPLYKIEYACHCRGYIQDDGLHVHLSCEHNPNCYYKQLKRLEQEREELKQDKDKYYQQTLDDEITISDLIEEIQKLKADRTLERITKLSIENTRLEQENKELKEMLSKEPKAMQAFQIAYSGLKKDNEVLWGMIKDYKTALEEIKKMVTNPYPGEPKDVLNIINEVLNDN